MYIIYIIYNKYIKIYTDAVKCFIFKLRHKSLFWPNCRMFPSHHQLSTWITVHHWTM